MKLLRVLLCFLMTVNGMAIAGFAQQQTVQVSPTSSPAADQFAHVILTGQAANATMVFPVANGMYNHQFTWTSAATVTGLTVTFSGASFSVGPWSQMGANTSSAGTLTGTGTYTWIQVIYSGYTGSGLVNGDYYGGTTIAALGGGGGGGGGSVTQGTTPWIIAGQTSGIPVPVTGGASPLPVTVESGSTTAVTNTSGTPLVVQGLTGGVPAPVTVPADIYNHTRPTSVNQAAVAFQYDGNQALIVAGTAYFMLATTSITSAGAAPFAAGLVLGDYQCGNADATNYAYLQMFDTTGAVTLGTTVPSRVLSLPPLGGTIGPLVPLWFANGLKVYATTTPGGSTSAVTAINCTWGYKLWQ